jgi:hypothetical protein
MTSSDTTLTHLKLVGKINAGEKLVTRAGKIVLVNDATFTGWLYRRLYGDSRHDTLLFLKGCIRECMGLAPVTPHLVRDLQQASIGLENLKATYSGDKVFACELEKLQEEVDDYLKSLVSSV